MERAHSDDYDDYDHYDHYDDYDDLLLQWCIC